MRLRRWLAGILIVLGGAAPVAAATFDLAIISNGYTDRATFEADAQKAYDTLLTYEPYTANAALMTLQKVWNTTDLQCVRSPTMSRLLTCNTVAAYNALTAQGIVYDKALVLVNSTDYGGSGGYFAVSYRGSLMGKVVVHEFGHSLAGLKDEYTLYGGTSGLPNTQYANCYNGTSASWPYTGCQYQYWKRSTSCSIMKSLDCPYFNAVSQAILRPAIERFTGVPTPTPIPTPTPTPTPTPNSYSCPGGTLCTGVPVTGIPDQVVCGTNLKQWVCTSGGWKTNNVACSCTP